MKTRAPPGREGSMERTKDFYNGMNYAKKQLQQREHERRRRKRYFIKQKLCGIAVIAVLGIATPFAPLLDLDIIGNYFKMLNGYSPTFTSFSGGVYEMDLTRTAVNNFATHCSKLKPEIEGSALKTLEKTLQHKPNYFMDTTKFIKRLATYVAVEHTAFIIPIEDEYGRLCGWYPLRAERCEVIECEGQLYLRYLFANGSYGAIEFERVGIMTDLFFLFFHFVLLCAFKAFPALSLRYMYPP